MIESMMVFTTSIGFVGAKAGKHFPAPVAAITAIQKAAGKKRDDALLIEAQAFAKIAKTQAADSLIGLLSQLGRERGELLAIVASISCCSRSASPAPMHILGPAPNGM